MNRSIKQVKLFIYKNENDVKLNKIKCKSFFSAQCFLAQKINYATGKK